VIFFLNRLRVLEQGLATSWISQNILDCSNIVNVNNHAHKWNGIALVVLTLIHVWSILLPCVTHQWKAQIVPGTFEFPLSERAPVGFKDANVETKTMSLQVDDVFRMVEMTLLLCVLLPLSIRWMNRHYWHLGIHVHRFVTVLYFVDIVRRHSHPHSWVLNTPVFLIWILDKILSLDWRRLRETEVHRVKISNDYIVLYWNDNASSKRASVHSIGRNYLMKLDQSSCLESRHPFTSFSNRSSSTFNFVDWGERTNGSVIRVFDHKRTPRIGGPLEIWSHTKRLAYERMPLPLSIWGPFQGDMTELIPKKLLVGASSTGGRSIVLAGSGSAINFMIDLMMLLSWSTPEIPVQPQDRLPNIVLLHTTQDLCLHQWVSSVMASLLKEVGSCKNTRNIQITLACTSSNTAKKDMLREWTTDATDRVTHGKSLGIAEDTKHTADLDSDSSFESVNGIIDDEEGVSTPAGAIWILTERIDFRNSIPVGSDVFCQGSSGFKAVVESACRSKKGIFFG